MRSRLVVLMYLFGIVGMSEGWMQPSSSFYGRALALSSSRSRPTNPLVIMMGQRGKRIRREKRKALQEPTPPRILTPYGPIRLPKPPRPCDCCRGRGLLRCSVCEGRGVVRATGNNKNNQIQADRLLGSQWTSVEIYKGHRHHTVMELRGSPKKKLEWQVRMQNCCGDQQDFWIPVVDLKNKMIWRKGWQTLEDIQRANGGALRDIRLCFRCKGDRILPCVECSGEGEIPAYEPLHD